MLQETTCLILVASALVVSCPLVLVRHTILYSKRSECSMIFMFQTDVIVTFISVLANMPPFSSKAKV